MGAQENLKPSGGVKLVRMNRKEIAQYYDNIKRMTVMGAAKPRGRNLTQLRSITFRGREEGKRGVGGGSGAQENLKEEGIGNKTICETA